MALLFFDGFEAGLRGIAGTTHHFWGVSDASSTNTGASLSRTGVRSLRMGTGSGEDFVVTRTLSPSGGFIVGFSFLPAVPLNNANASMLRIREGTTTHLELGFDATGKLELRRGAAGTVLGTAASALPTGGYSHIEIKGTIHDTTGTVEVRVDGTAVIGPLTSQDTRNAGSGTWDNIAIITSSINYTYIDDFYVCDDSGSAPHNTFLGPTTRIESLLAQSGNGSNTGLTCSTGSDHGALVDEAIASPNGDTDYNEHATAGNKDTYNMSNMSLTGTVLAVQTVLYVRKTDATARTVCPVIRHSGADYDGTAVAPTTSFTWLSQIYPQNPGTSAAWASVSEVNAIEIGMKVVS